MYTTTAILGFLTTLAAAAPALVTRQEYQTFGAMSLRSGSSIHFSSINASGYRFYLNKPTAAYCPSEVTNLNCTGFSNNTLFAGSSTGTGLGMAVAVPGGQQVYVAADGALGYSIPHSAQIPEGAVTTPFKFTPAAAGQAVGELEFNGNGFEACPVANSTWLQVYAVAVEGNTQTGCTGFDFATVAVTGENAWEYT